MQSIQFPFLVGVLQIANVFLAIVAGIIAVSLFRSAHRQDHLKPWKMLIPALVLFAAEEVVKAVRAFTPYEPVWLTHVIPSFILAFLIAALVMQIQISGEMI